MRPSDNGKKLLDHPTTTRSGSISGDEAAGGPCGSGRGGTLGDWERHIEYLAHPFYQWLSPRHKRTDIY